MPLYITEHEKPSILSGNIMPMVEMPPLAQQKITVSGASAQSASFSSTTRVVGLHTSEVCSVSFGTNPTAAITDRRLAANTTEYFEVLPSSKVAVITNT